MDIKENTESFISRCRSKGLSLTRQRQAIFTALAASCEHPDAETVCRGLRKSYPGLSLGTVYRNLEIFARYGFISRVSGEGASTRFDANQTPHHHLICRSCGNIEDYYDERLQGLQLAAQEAGGFTAETYRIDFRGLCAGCRKKSNSTGSPGDID